MLPCVIYGGAQAVAGPGGNGQGGVHLVALCYHVRIARGCRMALVAMRGRTILGEQQPQLVTMCDFLDL